MSANCFHCGLEIPQEVDLSVEIDNQPRQMCCAGCQAVAQAIVENNLTDFYRYRTENAPTAKNLIPEALQKLQIYDNPEIQKRFVREAGEHLKEASLILEGITCAACIWLNEKHLKSLKGILNVQINYTTHRARVQWNDQQIKLSEILQAISAIGYFAHPYDPAKQQALLDKERRQQLRRVGVAGVLSMQVMMTSVGLYAGDYYGIEHEFRVLFYWVNLLMTIPVLLYSAYPFYQNAWRDLKQKQLGMDVPVSLGIWLAFLGSVWETIFHGQHVYYDSVTMFVFLLLLGRYFELMARHRSAQASESLVQMLPAMANLIKENTIEIIAVAELKIGDIVLIKAGESIPADGKVINGQSSVNEALLTGENLPLLKKEGDQLIAGTINIESPLQMRVEKLGDDTVLSHILRLLERAQSEKPYITQIADKIAAWFVVSILFLAVIVAWYWWTVNPALWLPITLAVLVVTCPCALSLATPVAITAATGTLTKHGLLTTRGHALETLARATHFVFDKTGTLTDGNLQLLKTHLHGDLNERQVLEIAGALEQHSEHPIAKAILKVISKEIPKAEQVINQAGAGLQGIVNGETYYLGTAEFLEQNNITISQHLREELQLAGDTLVWLANTKQICAAFALSDHLREGAFELVQNLQKSGIKTLLLTGDHEQSAKKVAQAVGITDIGFQLSPDDKLQKVKELQNNGAIVAMLGDGVNDAPVLAAAQISIAMGSGTQVARASADMILLSENLQQLQIGLQTARKTLRIIHQNLWWALGYNVFVLPAAMMGFIVPWIAGVGMAGSSLLVVFNALRLTEKKTSNRK
jgi:P-type Cu2+ transporter